jgi:hypothetical protein
MLRFHNEFNESWRADLRPFGSVQNEPGKQATHIQANQIEILDLERVLTRKAPTWHYAVQMERGRKSITQMARELEPVPSGWSQMSIGDAMHLLRLPEASSVTTSGLRQALEQALEHAKFDEIPVLLGAYRILEGHFGGPEGAATRQDDPTSASWPALSARATTGSGAVELDPWEDDPSITVSDIRMIEPASVTASSSLQVSPWFQAGHDPQQIVIDDFNPSQTNPLQAQASTVRRAPNVVMMHAANSPSISRAWRMSIPGLLAVGISGLLVVWAYHPTAQGLVANVFGQPQPQAVMAESIATPQVPQAEASVQTVPNPQVAVPAAVEAAPSVISSAPVMVREPESEISTVNAEASLKSSGQALKPSSSEPVSSKPASSEPISSKPTQIKPISSKPVQTKSNSSMAVKTTKPNVQTKPTVIARQPIISKPRTVARLKSSLNKPRLSKPRLSKPQPVLSQTKKMIQVVTNAVTQAPKATVGKPLRVSRQASSQSSSQTTRRTTQGTRVSTTVAPKRVMPKNVTTSNPQVDTSITNPIKLASSNERDAASARAIANPQPVSSIQVPKASGKIDNLSREDFGQRYFNRKLYEVWQRDGAKLRYGSWDSVPLELQILENDLFRSAIYLDGPSGNDAKDNEKPVQP